MTRRRAPHLPVLAAATIALSLAPDASAYDGAYLPIEGGAWDIESGPVPYSLEPAGSDDIDDDSELEALRSAFRAWACVPRTTLRFEESDAEGVVAIADDGVNSLFWDESGDFGLGPATLGVTVGDAGQGVRGQADIVFNGVDSSWSTDDGPSAVDVGSIAVHEIGHFLGLDHPCDKSGDQEENCNGPERSIMTPAWDGAIGRTPLPDDEEGVRALYPDEGDGSGCEGPFRKGEACACDGECIEGLVCVQPAGEGRSVCGDTCASDDSECGGGFACVLGVPEDDDRAEGICVPFTDGAKPPGAVCLTDGECASGTCALLFDLTRSLCLEDCDDDDDCTEGRRCYDGFCLGGASHEECPVPPGPCGCAGTSTTSPVGGALALVVAVALLARRRHR